ncbi:hypothetical protein SBV1_370055 [Verrucomicrobia bacterium]|nr:hypothetical protein SBV1_370055 [Verrucomicrobiota bacterium]
MLDRRVRLCFKVLPIQVLVLLLVSYWLRHSMCVAAQVGSSSKVRDLQQQRLATLRNLVKITTEHHLAGQSSSDELWTATRARDEAELDLCTSNKERIAILERVVAEAKELEEQDIKLAANKLLSRTCLLQSNG